MALQLKPFAVFSEGQIWVLAINVIGKLMTTCNSSSTASNGFF